MKLIFGFLLIWLNVSMASGQGNISTKKLVENYIETEKCKLDSTAKAMYLLNSGLAEFFYSIKHRDYGHRFKKKIILKIFDKSILHDSIFEITLLSQYNYRTDNYHDLKINLFKLNSGTIKKTKIKSKKMKFAYNGEDLLLDKELLLQYCDNGDIIEINYSKGLNYKSNFQSWQFDQPIPVMSSNYKTVIPVSIIYKYSLLGDVELNVNETEITPGPLLYYSRGGTPNSGSKRIMVNGNQVTYHPAQPDLVVRNDKAINLNAKSSDYTSVDYKFVYSYN